MSTGAGGVDDRTHDTTVGGDESERRQHWDAVYAEKDTDEVSWFEASPTLSLAMLDAVGADPSMAVIDIGAGASRLAGALLERGFTDITALDVADDGLAAARSELGPDADKIIWLVADLLAWSPVAGTTSGTTERSSTSSPPQRNSGVTSRLRGLPCTPAPR